MGAPQGGLLVGYRHQPLTPRFFKEAPPPNSGGSGEAGTSPDEAPVAHGPEGGTRQQEARERARRVEDLGEELPIHHRRPLQYAYLFPAEDINAAENLAMLREYAHKEINLLWVRFREARPNPTADEVRRAAEIIDRQFEPWYHRVENPPGLSKTAQEASKAALHELRSHFPGLE
jgi:hypothetical protein